MELSQAIQLINHPALPQPSQARWADLGCGSGLFTYALANLLADGSTIEAIDKSAVALSKHPKPNHTVIEQRQADFTTEALNLSNLDGLLMANSLHYVRDKTTCIQNLSSLLNERGSFLIVEYETDVPNPWVPYPIQYASLRQLFEAAGFRTVTWLRERPSVYGRAKMYAAHISR